MISQLAAVVVTSPLPRTSANLVQNLLYIAFGTLGGISLIIMVWAGMKYTLSSGDPAKTAEAKNQVIYAAVGIVVAISASALVTFAIRNL